jgi:hypothetical protein
MTTNPLMEDVPDYGRDVLHMRQFGQILPLCGNPNLEPTGGPGITRSRPTTRCPLCLTVSETAGGMGTP